MLIIPGTGLSAGDKVFTNTDKSLRSWILRCTQLVIWCVIFGFIDFKKANPALGT